MSELLALIIEDDEAIASIYVEALQMAGYGTEIVGNGRLATQRLGEIRPVLILLDLHLPYVSGAELLKQIRADSRLDDTRIIVASADGTWSGFLDGDVDFVLNKPISYVQLRTLASRLLKNGIEL